MRSVFKCLLCFFKLMTSFVQNTQLKIRLSEVTRITVFFIDSYARLEVRFRKIILLHFSEDHAFYFICVGHAKAVVCFLELFERKVAKCQGIGEVSQSEICNSFPKLRETHELWILDFRR